MATTTAVPSTGSTTGMCVVAITQPGFGGQVPEPVYDFPCADLGYRHYLVGGYRLGDIVDDAREDQIGLTGNTFDADVVDVDADMPAGSLQPQELLDALTAADDPSVSALEVLFAVDQVAAASMAGDRSFADLLEVLPSGFSALGPAAIDALVAITGPAASRP